MSVADFYNQYLALRVKEVILTPFLRERYTQVDKQPSTHLIGTIKYDMRFESMMIIFSKVRWE